MFISIITIQCTNKELAPQSFIKFYEQNKSTFLKKRTSNLLSFNAEYIPTSVLAARDLDLTPGKFNTNLYKSNYNNYDSAYYFKFKIEAPDKQTLKALIKTKENLSKLNQYLITDIHKDFTIEVGDKKIGCGLVNSESDIQMQNCFTFIMSFEKTQFTDLLNDDITLIYNDNIFQNGVLKFHFDKKDINNFPKIKAL